MFTFCTFRNIHNQAPRLCKIHYHDKIIQLFVDNGVTTTCPLPCKVPDTSLAIESTSVLNQSFSNCFHKIIVPYKLGQNIAQVNSNNVRQTVHSKKLELLIVKQVFWHIFFLNLGALSPGVPQNTLADERVDEQIANSKRDTQ